MAYNKKAHLRDNIEAIRLMFRLEKEQLTATPEEAGTLAAYSGFGGIKAVLSPFGKLTDILRWTQADRELFPWLRNFTTSCVTEPLTNANTSGWWKA